MELRSYQLEAIEAIYTDLFSSESALCVLPTGSGKTEVFIGLLRKCLEVKPDIKVAILMGRIDLVAQTERRLSKVLGAKHVGVYCGSLNRKETNRPFTVVSIQSIDKKHFPAVNMIIVDEVHRLDQDGGAYLKFIEKSQDQNHKLKIVGFTATAFRSDGVIYGEGKIFKKVSYLKTIKEMIVLGYLCEPKMKGSAHSFDTSKLRMRAGEYRQEDVDELVNNDEMVLEQVTDALSRMQGRKSVFWNCANIDHCNRVANTIMALGESVTTVHSKLPRPTRDANLSAFMTGHVRHVSFVSVLSEGFDHPPGDCLVLMRPTRSPVLYVQTCGRVLRPYPDKNDALILDYGQVIKTLGPLDEPNVKGQKGDEDGEAPVKECPSCLTIVFAGVRECPDCGHRFPDPPPVTAKLDRKADGEGSILSKVKPPEKSTALVAFLEMHESQNGNLCVKITYCAHAYKNLFGQRFGDREYFVTSSPWAMERLERRLTELDMSVPGIPFDGEIESAGPFEVVKTKEGQYDRILSVKKLAAAKVVEPEVDTSFDFGANTRAL